MSAGAVPTPKAVSCGSELLGQFVLPTENLQKEETVSPCHVHAIKEKSVAKYPVPVYSDDQIWSNRQRWVGHPAGDGAKFLLRYATNVRWH